MSYNIVATPTFKKEIKRLTKKFHSLKQEYQQLISSLEHQPNQGTPLGNDCFKIRLAIASKGKGKSGGARVITYLLVANHTVFLLTIYDKAEQADISNKELQQLLGELE